MKQCDICGKEAKARSVELLKPTSEWFDKDLKEYEYIDLCYTCSSSTLWGIRDQAMQYSEDSNKYKGVTNAEINSLLNDSNECE